MEAFKAKPQSNSSSDEILRTIMLLQQSQDLSRHVGAFMDILMSHKVENLPFLVSPFLSDEWHEANFLR